MIFLFLFFTFSFRLHHVYDNSMCLYYRFQERSQNRITLKSSFIIYALLKLLAVDVLFNFCLAVIIVRERIEAEEKMTSRKLYIRYVCMLMYIKCIEQKNEHLYLFKKYPIN